MVLIVIALLLFSGSTLAVFLLWNPLPREVQKRVGAVARSVASRAPESHATASLWRDWADIFRRFFTFGMRHNWGVKISSLALMLIGVTAGGAVWLLSYSVLRLPPWLAAPIALAAFWAGPQWLARKEQDKADRAFLELFPDAIDMIIRMLRASLPVSVAIRTVAREASPPINEVFTVLADQIDIGIAFEDALGMSSGWIGLTDYRFFAAAIALQRTTGGNLTATLEILVDIIRKRRTVRLKVKAATAEERMSSYVLGAMPFLVFGALLAVSPSYLAPLVDDPRGNVILVVGVAMLMMAFFTMRLMMRNAVRM